MKSILLAVLLAVGALVGGSVEWIEYLPVKKVEVGLAPVLADIESHLSARHQYRNESDRVNWVHEGSHGIASDLRRKYRSPGFYVLENKAAIFAEPKGTLAEVAQMVPASLRGRGYRLYMVSQQRYWNGEPTYVFDEFVAFTNGSQARNEYGMEKRTDTVESMVEFIPYALCTLKASGGSNPKMVEFVRWQIERSLKLHEESGVTVGTLNILRTSPDAESLRVFTRTCLGEDWAKSTLGF